MGHEHALKPRSNAAGRKPLVARFGGIPLKRKRKATLPTVSPVRPRTATAKIVINGFSGAVRAKRGRWHIEVHQIRKLADLATPGRPQSGWRNS